VIVPKLCDSCAHLKADGRTCSAFPGRIPASIAYGGDHRDPVPGDHGIQYQVSEKEGAADRFDTWSRRQASLRAHS